MHGLRRYWGAASHERKYSALTVVKDNRSFVNGLLVKISEQELDDLIEREVGYTRFALNHDQIYLLSEGFSLNANDEVFVFGHEASALDFKYVIPQSYLDSVISGLLDIGENAVRLFFQSTYGWDRFILVNDRARFWWDRKTNENHRTVEIDAMIGKYCSWLLERRVDESLVRHLYFG